jgi:hypothetical protein
MYREKIDKLIQSNDNPSVELGKTIITTFMGDENFDKEFQVNDIQELISRVFEKVEQTDDELIFRLNENSGYRFYHCQNCCERVWIEDVNGDLDDLVGSPIIVAKEVIENDPNACESATWTFYKFATQKGYVTVRWIGESNGYYSESVDFSSFGIH